MAVSVTKERDTKICPCMRAPAAANTCAHALPWGWCSWPHRHHCSSEPALILTCAHLNGRSSSMLTGLSGCDCGGEAPAVPGLRMACCIVSTCSGSSSFMGTLCAT